MNPLKAFIFRRGLRFRKYTKATALIPSSSKLLVGHSVSRPALFAFFGGIGGLAPLIEVMQNTFERSEKRGLYVSLRSTAVKKKEPKKKKSKARAFAY